MAGRAFPQGMATDLRWLQASRADTGIGEGVLVVDERPERLAESGHSLVAEDVRGLVLRLAEEEDTQRGVRTGVEVERVGVDVLDVIDPLTF